MQNRVWFEDPRTVLKRYGFTPKKSWGQNFLISPVAVEKIVAACVDETGRRVIEIGAGVGTLTAGLLHAGAQVTVVERDPDMVEVLHTEFDTRENFTVFAADAASFDYAACFGTEKGVVAGNLPYQITGRILRRVLDVPDYLLRAVFMVQQEVADRMVAGAGAHARGALSVMLDARCRMRIVQRLAPTAFHPAPKVRSAVVELIPREQPLYGELSAGVFDRVVKAAFATRRKTLRNALTISGIGDATTVQELLEEAALDGGLRAEVLTTDQFVALARQVVRRAPLVAQSLISGDSDGVDSMEG